MKQTYFTSDLHLFQKNIIKKFSRWETGGLREFDSIAEMNETILDNINATVTEEDELWILGDLMFSKDPKDLQYIFHNINCKNINIILGNHDYILRKGRDKQYRFRNIYDYRRISVSYPLEGQDPHRDKWKGKQQIILSHYAMRVWDKSHHGSWMLYGHSHDSLDNMRGQEDERLIVNSFYGRKKTMDVGIDTAFRVLGEYRPFSFWEIKDIMDNKEVLTIDHHEKRP